LIGIATNKNPANARGVFLDVGEWQGDWPSKYAGPVQAIVKLQFGDWIRPFYRLNTTF